MPTQITQTELLCVLISRVKNDTMNVLSSFLNSNHSVATLSMTRNWSKNFLRFWRNSAVFYKVELLLFLQPLSEFWLRLRLWNCRATTRYYLWATSTLTLLHNTIWTENVAYLTQRETCRSWTQTLLDFPCWCHLFHVLNVFSPSLASVGQLLKSCISSFLKCLKCLRIWDTLTEIVTGRLKEPKKTSAA